MIESLIDIIALHAKECYPNECCGLVIARNGLEYIPCVNVVPDNQDDSLGPTSNFAINPKQYAGIEALGEIKFIVHSHPDATSRPSKTDIAYCNESAVNWLILGYPSLDWRIVEPVNPELIGRDFVLGVTDCYGLVMDYYEQKLNIKLSDFRVNYHWWEKGENLYIDNYEKAGFIEVTEPQKHDVILMQVSAPVANHAGIMIDSNTLLHHLYGRKSTRTPYGGYYRDRTIKILRHKNLIEV